MYLKYFTFNGTECYTLNSNNDIYKQNIKEICKEKYLYELRDHSGKIFLQNFYEKNVFAKYENEFSERLPEIIQKLDSSTNYFDDDILRIVLLLFCSMVLRNPLTINSTKEAAEDIGIFWDDVQSRNNAIIHNKELLVPFAEKFYLKFNFIILDNATDTPFITSNVPFTVNYFHNLKFWYFPLSTKYMFILEPIEFMKKKRSNWKVIIDNAQMVNNLNINFISKAEHSLIISNTQSTLKDYKRLIIHNE